MSFSNHLHYPQIMLADERYSTVNIVQNVPKEIKKAISQITQQYVGYPISELPFIQENLQQTLDRLGQNRHFGEICTFEVKKVESPIDAFCETVREFIKNRTFDEYELECASTGKDIEVNENEFDVFKNKWNEFVSQGNASYTIIARPQTEAKVKHINITFTTDNI